MMKKTRHTQRKYKCYTLTQDPETILENIRSQRYTTRRIAFLLHTLGKEKLEIIIKTLYEARIKEPLYITLKLKKTEKKLRDLNIPISLDPTHKKTLLAISTLRKNNYIKQRECTPIEKDWIVLTTKLMNRIIKTRKPYNIIIENEKITIKPTEPETLPYRLLLTALEFITPKQISDNEKPNASLLYTTGILTITENKKYVLVNRETTEKIIKTIEKRNEKLEQKIKNHIQKIKQQDYTYYYLPRTILYKLKNIKKTRKTIDLIQLQKIETLIHDLINTIDEAYLTDAVNTIISLRNAPIKDIERQLIQTKQVFP